MESTRLLRHGLLHMEELTDSQWWLVHRDAQRGRLLLCMWLQAFVSPRT